MTNIIQQTLCTFSRSSSRRMDAELCIVNLCQPELESDTQSVIARLTKIEDLISTGAIVRQNGSEVEPTTAFVPQEQTPVIAAVEELIPREIKDEAPVGFWADLVAAIRMELSPVMRGFFTTSPNAPMRGIIAGDRLVLVCTNKFIIDIINKPEIISLVSRKAIAKLGRTVRVVVTDDSGLSEKNAQMEQLLDFGRNHSDIVKITEE